MLHDVSYPSGVFMPPHRHCTANITLLVGGDLDETTEDGLSRAKALSVVFKPSGVDHSTRIGPRGLRSFVLELDCSTERALRRRIGVFDRCRWTDDPALVTSLCSLWARVGAPEDVTGAVDRWLRELSELRCRPDSMCWKSIDADDRPDPVANALRRLEREFLRPLGPAELAEDLGMHPVSVTRLFRRHLGRGVKACLRSVRVRQAADRLAQTQVPLACVATQTGFSDQAHLCRDFKRTLGLTPGHYRRLARGPGSG